MLALFRREVYLTPAESHNAPECRLLTSQPPEIILTVSEDI
jgi:hypothetical protein